MHSPDLLHLIIQFMSHQMHSPHTLDVRSNALVIQFMSDQVHPPRIRTVLVRSNHVMHPAPTVHIHTSERVKVKFSGWVREGLSDPLLITN